MNQLSDCHMHTKFSLDSETEPIDMIKGAIQKGLKTICITDHQDIDYPGADFTFDADTYFRELLHLKEAYQNQIEVRIGVEIGLQPNLGEVYHQYIRSHPFDFVIGSVHVIDRADPYDPDFFSKMTDEEGYALTFKRTVDNIKAIADFDVLGHIDYIVRYGREKAKHYSYAAFAPYLDEILRTVIAYGKGIELNTSGFKYDLGFCHPHPDIIKRYRELGGETITIGADGHKPEHIAYAYDKVADILRSCGFKYYTEFRERKPIFKQLP